MLYLSLLDGYHIRKALCHFGPIWKKKATISTAKSFNVDIIASLLLTFLSNGQFPVR